ncbi:noncanonical pyrimidine nucleotidase, YjjG family [Atopobacter sp. AH10]|uniref:YjjG family noncanonical pyrimidine nucleotidase n=1 Tax=Atopobacter sp. AH10 TaxID=2315861 RepID=UPI000EF24A32|nr:YjjG family noncanonical pyrimidine nucleotidase [Atopobacter sp. AH10]RLK64057.1 noncanonical pyrimidine nucleotidase, YjjG family [Atopobacter sp. AH10]
MLKKSDYKLLLMDVDMTLLDFDAGEKEALKEALACYHYQITSKDLDSYHEINESYWRRFERGEIKKEAIYINRFRDFLKELKLPLDPEKVSRTYMDHICLQTQLIPGAKEVLQWLKDKGYQLAVVTNGTARNQESRLKLSGLEKYFDKIFISEKIGTPKPDPAFFSYVLDQFKGVSKENILLVGDSLTSDIKGGLQSGIDTCWIDWKKQGTDLKTTYIIHDIKELPSLLEK